MPNIPMALLAMLTCSRIGAIHNVAFAGTPAKRLAERLDEAKPKLIFTASGGFEAVSCKHKTEEEPFTVVKYSPILEEAFGMTKAADKDVPRLIYQRPEG